MIEDIMDSGTMGYAYLYPLDGGTGAAVGAKTAARYMEGERQMRSFTGFLLRLLLALPFLLAAFLGLLAAAVLSAASYQTD